MAFFTRTPNLKVYSDYRKYRPQLASDFNHLCAYCEMSETYLRTQSAFGVDHFRPFALFPELDCVYTNLYYCCNDCNRCKGRKWPSAEDLASGEGFTDPCLEDPYIAHLQTLPDGSLEARSPSGAFTIRTVRLNREACRQFRMLRTATKVRLDRLRGILVESNLSAEVRETIEQSVTTLSAEWYETYNQRGPSKSNP